MADLTFSHDCIILDACCVINLYASQQMEEILTVIPPAVCIAAYVKDKEILKTYNRSTGNAEDIDLQVLIERDILLPVDLDLETEAETHVTFAAVLDDGEAITGAIAFHRKWAIATDDRAAINLFTHEAPHLQIITTPELVKYWADKTQSSSEMINQCLQNIAFSASYRPSKKHPLYNWWQKHFHF